MMKRLKDSLSEQIGARAIANVWSGRETKWYKNPFAWISDLLLRLTFFVLILCELVYRLFYYVAVPLLIVCMFVTMHRMNDQLDRIESKSFGTVMEWFDEKVGVDVPIRKWVWSCNWSIHDKDWDFDDGNFNKSVSGCGAGNQAWKEVNYVWTRDEALAIRNKHNEETGHTAWIGENLTLTPVPKTETE